MLVFTQTKPINHNTYFSTKYHYYVFNSSYSRFCWTEVSGAGKRLAAGDGSVKKRADLGILRLPWGGESPLSDDDESSFRLLLQGEGNAEDEGLRKASSLLDPWLLWDHVDWEGDLNSWNKQINRKNTTLVISNLYKNSTNKIWD